MDGIDASPVELIKVKVDELDKFEDAERLLGVSFKEGASNTLYGRCDGERQGWCKK